MIVRSRVEILPDGRRVLYVTEDTVIPPLVKLTATKLPVESPRIRTRLFIRDRNDWRNDRRARGRKA